MANIGLTAFKRPLLFHRNGMTTGWKRLGKVSTDSTKAIKLILDAELAENVISPNHALR